MAQSAEEQKPKLAFRDGAVEVWDVGGGFQVITPLGTFFAPSVDYARYVVADGILLRKLIKGDRRNG